MKKKRAIVKCQILVSNIKNQNAAEFMKCLSPTLQVNNISWHPGPNHKNKLMFDAQYGPVIGGWQSDVIAKVKRGLEKAGSTAGVQVLSYQRNEVAS